jgi:hypothetical protein
VNSSLGLTPYDGGLSAVLLSRGVIAACVADACRSRDRRSIGRINQVGENPYLKTGRRVAFVRSDFRKYVLSLLYGVL